MPRGPSCRLYAARLLGPFALPLPVTLAAASPMLRLPLLLAPPALRLRRDLETCVPGPACNALLFGTFRLGAGFAVPLSAGAVSSRLIG